MPTPCPSDAELLRFLEQSAPKTLVQQVDSHLDKCAECSDVIAEYARYDSGSVQVPDTGVGPLVAGDRVGRYEICDLLGTGGMSWVYVARDPELDRRIALKVLKPSTDDDTGLRLSREARAMAALSHPNVVSVFDAGIVDGRLFIAMEYIEGPNLREWLDRKRSRDEILQVFRDAGRGLQAAHNAGLVHRDFKPENVLVGTDGVVRVSDFGLAKTRLFYDATNDTISLRDTGGAMGTDNVTQAGVLSGTPTYMSPEQVSGQRVTAKSDQFSYCVALYEALSGTRPYRGDNFEELAANITAGGTTTADVLALPTWLQRVLARGLAAAPDRRYDSIEELVGVLAVDPMRRRRRRAGIVGAVSVSAVVGGALAFGIAGARDDSGEEAACAERAHVIDKVWNAERKHQLHVALGEKPSPKGQETIRIVSRRLDDYTQRLGARHRSACLAAEGLSAGIAIQREQDACFAALAKQVDSLQESIVRLGDVPSRLTLASVVVWSLDPPWTCGDLDRPRFRLAAQGVGRDNREARATTEAQILAVYPKIYVSGAVEQGAIASLVESARSLSFPPLLVRALQLKVEYLRAARQDAEVAKVEEELARAYALAKDDRGLAITAIDRIARARSKAGSVTPSALYDQAVAAAEVAVARAGNEPALIGELALHQARYGSFTTGSGMEKRLAYAIRAVDAFEAAGEDFRWSRLAALVVAFETQASLGRERDQLATAERLLGEYEAILGPSAQRTTVVRGKLWYFRARFQPRFARDAVPHVSRWIDHVGATKPLGLSKTLAPLWLARTLYWAEDHSGASRILEETLAKVSLSDYTNAYAVLLAHSLAAEIAADAGLVQAAVSHAVRARDAGLEKLDATWQIVGHSRLALRLWQAGRLREADSELAKAQALLANDTYIASRYEYERVRAYLLYDKNELQIAREAVGAASTSAEAAWGSETPEHAELLALQSLILVDSGDPSNAALACVHATELIAKLWNPGKSPYVLRGSLCEAAVHLAQGRATDAVDEYLRASDLADGVPAFLRGDIGDFAVRITEGAKATAANDARLRKRLGTDLSTLAALSTSKTPRVVALQKRANK